MEEGPYILVPPYFHTGGHTAHWGHRDTREVATGEQGSKVMDTFDTITRFDLKVKAKAVF